LPLCPFAPLRQAVAVAVAVAVALERSPDGRSAPIPRHGPLVRARDFIRMHGASLTPDGAGDRSASEDSRGQ